MMDDTFDKGSFFEGRRSSKITDADELIPRKFGNILGQGGRVFVAAVLTGFAFISPAWADGVAVQAEKNADLFPPIPFRETEFCAPLYVNDVGRTIDASFSAHDFSVKNPGKVGISIFPGQDLGANSPENLGTALVNSLRKRGVQAECFVHYDYGPKGTGIDFKIRGLSWGKDKPLQISKALNTETMNAVAAETKTGNMLLPGD